MSPWGRVIGALVVALLALCATGPASTAQEARPLRIVKQPALGYQQPVVVLEQKHLEKRQPGVEIE